MFQAMLDSFIEIIVCTRDITREEFFIHLSHTFAFLAEHDIRNDTIFASQSQYQIKWAVNLRFYLEHKVL